MSRAPGWTSRRREELEGLLFAYEKHAPNRLRIPKERNGLVELDTDGHHLEREDEEQLRKNCRELVRWASTMLATPCPQELDGAHGEPEVFVHFYLLARALEARLKGKERSEGLFEADRRRLQRTVVETDLPAAAKAAQYWSWKRKSPKWLRWLVTVAGATEGATRLPPGVLLQWSVLATATGPWWRPPPSACCATPPSPTAPPRRPRCSSSTTACWARGRGPWTW